ncbi:MAG: hypothetical protein KDA42_04795 [Planctomycetales bacterium]|nr:hypothetical protein [Planctomycetales bacterium]
MGNCLGIALAHLVISVAIFFLLESMIGAFQTGNLWLEIALGVAVLIASYLTLIQVARVILMTDFHRAAIFAACQFSLMLPLSLLLGATWWMVR